MSVPVLTFFNHRGGVGKTSLVYHVAWMLVSLEYRVLAVDLDPQAHLTARFLDEELLADLWSDESSDEPDTIFRCVLPLLEAGGAGEPRLQMLADSLGLLPGDLALSGFEGVLSSAWPDCLGAGELTRPFRITTAFWHSMQSGARRMGADIVLVDVGPTLGATNRAALVATDFVAVPLGADLLSLRALRALGPTLARWRGDWSQRVKQWSRPQFDLPTGRMEPIGYVVQNFVPRRIHRSPATHERWGERISSEYASKMLERAVHDDEASSVEDSNRIASLKHYRSLIPLAQEARKPIFELTAADGAIGSHSVAARESFDDFRELTIEILKRMKLP